MEEIWHIDFKNDTEKMVDTVNENECTDVDEMVEIF